MDKNKPIFPGANALALFLGPFFVLPSSADGSNDLWIAATALAYRMPVVTANARDFERVPGLEVLRY